MLLHPYQHLHFNFPEARATPERLRIRYALDYFDVAYVQAPEFLLEPYLEEPRYILSHKKEGSQNRDMLPAARRQRIKWVDSGYENCLIPPYRARGNIREAIPYAPVIHTRQAYGNTVVAVAALNRARVDAAAAAPSARHAARRTRARPAYVFDIYLTVSTITFAKAPCAAADTVSKFIAQAAPGDPRALPERPCGNMDFPCYARGVRFDDACLARAALPDYPIDRLRAGQFRSGEDTLWLEEISLAR